MTAGQKAGEDMKKKEQKIVRFYSDNPDHRKALQILEERNTEKYPSIQEFIIEAINAFGDKGQKAETIQNMEKQEWEEPLVSRIAESVGKVIEEKIPQIIMTYLLDLKMKQNDNALPVPAAAASEKMEMVSNTSENMIKEVDKKEDVLEKDVETNDLLDLDNFFQ